MAENTIKAIENIKKELRMGWPNGSAEAYKYVPKLLRRIEELEIALIPFAKVAVAEKNFAHPDKMVNVYMKHCITAKDVLDTSKSENINTEYFGDPAEI